MRRIILASGSPRRRELLAQIGLEFRVITSEADETTDITEPERYVKYLSEIKAAAVYNMLMDGAYAVSGSDINKDDIDKNNIDKNNIGKNNIDKSNIGKNNIDKNSIDNNNIDKEWMGDIQTDGYVVIGADTIVSHAGHILTKPKDKDDAYRILKELSGDCHQVYTGVTLMYSDGTKNTFANKTDVYCYELTDKEIWDYIATGEPMDKAGAYGIQGRFAAYIKGIDGDYNNVVGLPVSRVYQELKL